MAVARRGTQQAASGSSASVASISVSLPGAATAGDALIVGVVQTGTQAPGGTAVADNQTGNTYTRDQTGSITGTVSSSTALYSAPNIAASGTFTVTYTPPSSRFCGIAISEYSGVATSALFDVGAAGGSASSSTTYTTSTTAANTTTDAVAVAVVGNDSNVDQDIVTSAPFSGAAKVTTGATTATLALSDQILTTTAARMCTWTGENTKYDACIAVYKGVAAGGPTVKPLSLLGVG